MNSAIPKDVKQKDLFKSVVQMFNLYVDVDKTNNKNYIIKYNFCTSSYIITKSL